MARLKTFEELDCWKKASQLRRNLSELVHRFPSEEKYRLVDQIIRASRSVTANIAEGFGRFHYKEYARYCRQARGSVYELIDHLIVAEESRLISHEDFENYKNRIENCIKVLNGFISYLLNPNKPGRAEEPELEYQLTYND